ncbi:MAG TPA: ammonium transporter [Candidatus Limnocylindria bacterium]
MQIDTGDTAWLLMSAALVMLMTPALGFFYCGLVGKKNVLSTLTHSFFILCLISVQWVLWGYSLAFSPDTGAGLIGGLGWVALKGVGFAPNPDYAATVPHQAFMAFQMMFAVITPALITGAFAERVSFKAYVIFALLWSTLVYDPIAHWVWGTGGWLHALGALDFAGGTVVHISSGVSALVAAILIGRRLKTSEPHDATMTILGASLLWFGFNAGSALMSGGLATSAFVVTNTAAAMAGLTWLTVSWIHRGRPSVLGMAAGAVAGLVAITPASGFVDVSGSIIIGLGAGVLCYVALQLRPRLRVDDALDVWAVHGIGGTWGAIATGLFATVAINTAGANGLFFGNPQQLVTQLIAVGATWIYAAIATFVIVKAIDLTIGMRVREHEESLGLDRSQHGEIAYQLD